MSRGGGGFTPRGRGSFSSPNRGRGGPSSSSIFYSQSGFSRGGFGSGRGRGGGAHFSTGPPDQVFGTISSASASNTLEMGSFLHASEGDMLCQSTNPKIPYFNAPIFLENKSVIGKVDEILGPMNQVYFTVKPAEGIVAASFKKGDKVYIGGDKLLPLERFLPKPKGPPGVKRPGGRGGGVGRGGDRGRGRGDFSRGGRGGGARGGGRGNFSAGGRGGGRGGSFRGRGRGSY